MQIPKPKIIRSFRSSLALSINSKGEIVVKAPRLAPDFVIRNFLDNNVDWIKKALHKVGAHKTPKREYKEGEVFYFLGVERKLQFYNGLEIKSQEDALLFPKVLTFRIEKELHDWFVRNAKEKITERLRFHAEQMDARFTDLFFSDTKSKWGTCFADNSLQFNWRLIMAPLMVIDYVVIHELTHTTVKNHGDKFWRRVGLFTPAYKQHRKWLNAHQHLLMA